MSTGNSESQLHHRDVIIIDYFITKEMYEKFCHIHHRSIQLEIVRNVNYVVCFVKRKYLCLNVHSVPFR